MMKHPFILLLSLAALAGAEPAPPPSPAEQMAQFKLPPGFEIQLIASDPDIGQPMNLNFDVRGRLWVTHTIEYPYPARGEGVEPRSGRFAGIGEHEPRDRLSVLSGIGPDGTPAKIQHFANGLNIPIGQTPIGDGSTSMVYGIPSIFRCTDTDGDGVADETTTVYTRFGNIDVHGNASSFTRWIDGWIYGCHGFSNSSEILDGEGTVTKLRSGNTYRFREDGSRFESFTWGQTNPFGLTFDPYGNLYTSDCHSMPVYLNLPGAKYPGIGAGPDGLGHGPKMIDHSHGSTGICGPAYYAAATFPADWRDGLFICNPVTGRVHFDKLVWSGSSPMCDTQPDFITTEDKWFRPVDAQVGPDGALYIADFCNPIIGHYEAPLDHADRDRNHGRVWRVVWKGEDGLTAPAPLPDLTTRSTAELIDTLAHPNLLVRTLAANYLVDMRSAAELKSLLNHPPETPLAAAHALWILERKERLSDAALSATAVHPQALVRTHLLRILAERANWNATTESIVFKALGDDDAFVRRGAADAMRRHPHARFVPVLLKTWVATPPADTHLIHTIRMSLSAHLNDAGIVQAILAEPFDAAAKEKLLNVASASDSEVAAPLLLQFAEPGLVSTEILQRGARQLARYGNAEQVKGLVEKAPALFVNDLPGEVQFFTAIARGQQERGMNLHEQADLRTWLERLAPRVFSDEKPVRTWTFHPVPGLPVSDNPFGVRPRTSTDKNPDATFWDSIVGGESKTGLLRSQVFDLPPSFSFWICGHNGNPGSKEAPVNHARLILASSGEEIAREIPPRKDTAQKVTWTLDAHAGQAVRMEIVDAHQGGSYAWIGVGRFHPPVVAAPEAGPSADDGDLLELIGTFKLTQLTPHLIRVVGDTDLDNKMRSSALEGLEQMGSLASGEVTLMQLAANPGEASVLRGRAARLLGRIDTPGAQSALVNMLQTSAGSLQREAATALSQSPKGVNALLESVEAGKASPRLLGQPAIQAGINKHDSATRASALTQNLPPVSAEIDQKIKRHLEAFGKAKPNTENGKAVFARTCIVCHRIGNEGQLVGPQLDGIGQRGLERVLEDMLDPNRNVDAAYRLSVFTMNDGNVISGRERGREGALIVVVDFQGNEIRLPASEVKDRQQSELSLMPPTLVESLPEKDLYDLVTWLLTQ